MQGCAMSIFLFLKFYNFIKGIMHIHSILKKPKTNVFILHFSFKIFITCNRTMYSEQNMEKNYPNFSYINCISSRKVGVIIFPFIPGCFSLISNVTNFFIHSLNRFVFKKMLMCCWSSSIGCPICNYHT